MSLEPVVPVAALEHYAYCPRQCALIHGDGVWADNVHTVRGTYGHRRADTEGQRVERDHLVVRALPLWSERLGLSGRADAVEFSGDGRVSPVEYKIGVPHGVAAHLQLCAQALCLEEMLGRGVEVGFLWFSAPRRRITVRMDPDLRQDTLAMVERVRLAMQATRLPEPVNDARCDQCQLLGYCLPSVCAHPEGTSRYLAQEVFACGS